MEETPRKQNQSKDLAERNCGLNITFGRSYKINIKKLVQFPCPYPPKKDNKTHFENNKFGKQFVLFQRQRTTIKLFNRSAKYQCG